MNTKHFNTSILIVFLLSSFVSCTSEDPFVVCKISEYDCDYQHQIPGILTVTKGSSRKHYILTEKGMKKAEIKEGEPLSYSPKTGVSLIKEITDSSIDVFAVDTKSGKTVSSEIVLKPERTEKDGKPFFAFPKLLSGCIQDDGTINLLVNYENLLLTKDPKMPYSEEDAEIIDFLYVYEKGEAKNLKRYAFPQNEPSEGDFGDYFWEEPKFLQCAGEALYIFSEKQHANEISLFYTPQPNWILSRAGTQKEEGKITDMALIAYDDITFNYYSKKENALYTIARSSEKDKAVLRITGLSEGYELPESPVERKSGEFLFSETTDGKPLIFFIKARGSIEEEQRIELLPL